MHTYQFTAQIEKDPETGLFIGIVPSVPGAHTQGKTLDELNKNLMEVLTLCLEQMTKKERKNLPEFVGFQYLRIAV